jgi:hypothetical protein
VSAIYSLADTETEKLCAELIQKYHGELDTTGATFDIVFALRDPESDSDKPALSVSGHRVYGISKIHGLKERILGLKDAEIVLDGDAWPAMSAKVKSAVLDHQLQYFEVKRDKEGEFLLDDLNRPILALRKPDRTFGWFDAVADRHRDHSLEAMQLRRLFTEAGQTYLPFVDSTGSVATSSKKLLVRVQGGEAQEMTSDQLMESVSERFQ